MPQDPLGPLKGAIARGEALLLLGQDHSPDIVDQVLVDARELFRPNKAWSSLADLYADAGNDEAHRKAIASLFAKHQPPVALLELASMPWMAVITSAVDQVLAQAFLGVGSQRRIVELGPTQLSGVSASRASQLLYLIRAFGTSEAQGPAAALVPSRPTELAEARMIRLPAVWAALPRLVGLHGFVAMEGISSRDWVDRQGLAALAVALATLPPERAVWFGPASDQVRDALAGTVRFEEGTLQHHLQDWAKDENAQRAFRKARDRVFGIGERVVTIDQDGKSTQIRLTASEWRSIAQIGSLLDDVSVADLQAQAPGTKTELVAYLRRSHAGVPDWSGPARGFVFEQDGTTQLINAVRAFMSEPKASVLDVGNGRGARRVPYLLSGPPAAGKTMGLLRAAWSLRADHRLSVIWLLPSPAGINIVGIERVCRLLEQKGVRWVTLFLDTVEREEYFRLKQRLEAEGRRILVIGADSRVNVPAGETEGEPDGAVQRFWLSHQMSSTEITNFGVFLAHHRIPVPRDLGSRDFLRVLSAAIPEAQLGALPSLLDEYAQTLKEAHAQERAGQAKAAATPPLGSLADQLRKLYPHLTVEGEDAQAPVSRFSSDPLLRELLNQVLFCAQLDRPIPVDLLLKVLGNDLLNRYPTFAEAFERTALVQEVELDHDGTLALSTAHQLYGAWLLRGLYPDRSHQLDILRKLATSIDWDPDAHPGDNPHQDFVLDILRAVGPRGQYKDLYSAHHSLDRLQHLIGEMRERLGVEQPKLLTLEAIILGDLAVKESADRPEEAGQRCRLALELLARAEDLLRQRRPSEARSFELQRVLTLAADVRGTLINTLVRDQAIAAASPLQDIVAELARIEEDAIRAQAYSPTYRPLDIVCWAHRDAFDFLPENTDPAARVHLLETIESTLEVAEEEGLDPTQMQRFRVRQQELLYRLGKRQLSAEIARQMREVGDFTGELSLTRDRLREIERQHGDVRAACRGELTRLLDFKPSIIRQAHAVRFLHGLWVRSFLDGRLGEGGPKLVKASREDWRILEELARVRLQFGEHSELPFAMFFLAWALYQLNEAREGREVLSTLERQSLGNPRRVGELAYLTDDQGAVRVFRGRVVHSRVGQVRIAVPDLDAEILNIRPEVETRIAPAGLRLGEFVEISVALNYRGLQARPPEESQGGGSRGR